MAAADHAVHRDVRAVARGEELRPTALFGPFCAASAAPSILAPTGGGHPAAPALRASTFGELGPARRPRAPVPRAPVVGPAVRRPRRTSFSPNWVLG